MIYTNFKDKQLSKLGFGCMRFPMKDGKVDLEEAEKLVAYAYEHGVNYFDTAFSYLNSQSEPTIGRILKKYPRDSFYLASKFPGHEIRSSFDPKTIFETQLERCGVDYFDFYLLHNVYENSLPTYLDPKWGIMDYILEQKRNGRIRHLGFSTHFRSEKFTEFLDMYGDELEFCQIQLNYLDWTLQNAKEKCEILNSRGIPIWVMEPVRGGKLASLSPENEAKLKAVRPDMSPAAWAFRWVQNVPGVTMILSGMSSMEQVEDNIKTFDRPEALTDEENAALQEVAKSLFDFVPCTACRYCCTACPQDIPIPELITLLNDSRVSAAVTVGMAVDSLPKGPDACIECGSCRSVCPQGLDVPDLLAQLRHYLEVTPSWAELSAQREKDGNA